LFATAAGQVNMEYKNEITVFERNRVLEDSFAASREAFRKWPRAAQVEKVSELLGITMNNEGIHAEAVGEITKQNVRFSRFIVRRHNEVPIPLLVVYPPSIKKVIAWFHPEGKHVIADSTFLIQSCLDDGIALVIPDIRGIGELEDKADLNDPKYYNKEYRNAMISLHIGKPLVGQRVTDMLTVLQFIDEDEKLKGKSVELHCTGLLKVPAIHTAMFNEKLNLVKIFPHVSYLASNITKPLQKDTYSSVVPGMLKYYNLGDLMEITERVASVQYETKQIIRIVQ
jgi:hypothetical protein